MKKLKVYLILVSLIYANVCFSQSGWFWQNPLTNTERFNTVDFINENTGFVAGDVIIKTTNSGVTWYTIRGNASYTVDFIDNYTGYTFSYSEIVKTTNGGFNWIPIYYEPYLNWPSVCFVNQNTGFVTGWDNSSNLLKTTNGGLNWFHPQIGGLGDNLLKIYLNFHHSGLNFRFLRFNFIKVTSINLFVLYFVFFLFCK